MTHRETLFPQVSASRVPPFPAKTFPVYRNGRKITDLGPGSVFGELSLLDGGERTATVVMKTRGSLLRIHQKAFDELLDSSPTVGRRLLAQLADRLRAADRKIYG